MNEVEDILMVERKRLEKVVAACDLLKQVTVCFPPETCECSYKSVCCNLYLKNYFELLNHLHWGSLRRNILPTKYQKVQFVT